jgi:primosomal protein N''
MQKTNAIQALADKYKKNYGKNMPQSQIDKLFRMSYAQLKSMKEEHRDEVQKMRPIKGKSGMAIDLDKVTNPHEARYPTWRVEFKGGPSPVVDARNSAEAIKKAEKVAKKQKPNHALQLSGKGATKIHEGWGADTQKKRQTMMSKEKDEYRKKLSGDKLKQYDELTSKKFYRGSAAYKKVMEEKENFQELEILEILNEKIDRRAPAKRQAQRMQNNMTDYEKKLFQKMKANPKKALDELGIAINAYRKAAERATSATEGMIRGQLAKLVAIHDRLNPTKSIREAEEFPKLRKWWEYDKKDIMTAVYHFKNQLPPTGKAAYDKQWDNIKSQLLKKFPPPRGVKTEEYKNFQDFYVKTVFENNLATSDKKYYNNMIKKMKAFVEKGDKKYYRGYDVTWFWKQERMTKDDLWELENEYYIGGLEDLAGDQVLSFDNDKADKIMGYK